MDNITLTFKKEEWTIIEKLLLSKIDYDNLTLDMIKYENIQDKISFAIVDHDEKMEELKEYNPPTVIDD